MWRRALPNSLQNYCWFMAKHEHMSTPAALTHAALVGHLLRGTLIEGKSFGEAHTDARRIVGEASQAFSRGQVRGSKISERPMLDEAYYPR